MSVLLKGVVAGNAGAAVRAIAARLADTRPLVVKLTENAAASERKNIDESHAPDGTTYAKLKRPRPAGHRFGDLPLKDSETMYLSIQPHIVSDTEGWAGPDPSEAPYFPYQNQGAPAANISERPFIGISAADVVFGNEEADAFVITALEGGASAANLSTSIS